MASDTEPSLPDPFDAEKLALRDRARLARNAIAPEIRRSAAERVAERGLSDIAARPGIVGGYHPTAKEFDCLPLLARLEREGWAVTLPVITGEAPLLFRRWRPGDPLRKGQRAILEPVSGEILRPGFLLVPLLAFDAGGARLGYGGGHYDRTLEALRRDGPVLAIGLAFEAQEMAQLPVSPHDQRLDLILTPSGVRRFDQQL